MSCAYWEQTMLSINVEHINGKSQGIRWKFLWSLNIRNCRLYIYTLNSFSNIPPSKTGRCSKLVGKYNIEWLNFFFHCSLHWTVLIAIQRNFWLKDVFISISRRDSKTTYQWVIEFKSINIKFEKRILFYKLRKKRFCISPTD